jgi:hypothetical protein
LHSPNSRFRGVYHVMPEWIITDCGVLLTAYASMNLKTPWRLRDRTLSA